MPNYYYQGRPVEFLGMLGETVAEIRDPSRRLNRGLVTPVAFAQLEQREDNQPTVETPIESVKRRRASE